MNRQQHHDEIQSAINTYKNLISGLEHDKRVIYEREMLERHGVAVGIRVKARNGVYLVQHIHYRAYDWNRRPAVTAYVIKKDGSVGVRDLYIYDWYAIDNKPPSP